MQATVARFDPQTGDGEVLLDDGTRMEFDADAFAASGLRRLRLGQRLTLETDDERIRRVRLSTMP